jgi:hypothetical protein
MVVIELIVGGLFGLLVGIAAKKLEQWWYNR